jgi:hypothetical protein
MDDIQNEVLTATKTKATHEKQTNRECSGNPHAINARPIHSMTKGREYSPWRYRYVGRATFAKR